VKTILLIEDDSHLAEGLMLNLKAEGYQVVHVAQGNQALGVFADGNFSLILLDIMLPGMDGLTICRLLRERGETVPILFLTARDQTEERIEGLVAGGDDYITKPFDLKELLARIQGIFRRQAWLVGSDQQFDLTRRECMVAKYLIERPGQVVSRDQLLDAVWGYRAFPTNRTIDNFVLKLRKIFEVNQKNPVYFETIRGVGYRFSGPQR